MQIQQERMKALDPNENEIYKFLRCELAERIDMKKMMEKIKWSREQENLLEKGYRTKIW